MPRSCWSTAKAVGHIGGAVKAGEVSSRSVRDASSP